MPAAITACLDPPQPAAARPSALVLYPASGLAEAEQGGSVAFAVQALGADEAPVDDAELYCATELDAGLTFEEPIGATGATVRARTKRGTVAGVTVSGVVSGKVTVAALAAVRDHSVWCGLSAPSEGDAATVGSPVVRLTVRVSANEAGVQDAGGDGDAK